MELPFSLKMYETVNLTHIRFNNVQFVEINIYSILFSSILEYLLNVPLLQSLLISQGSPTCFIQAVFASFELSPSVHLQRFLLQVAVEFVAP